MTKIELTKRLTQALNETREALAREMRYSPDLRDTALVEIYENSIINLTQRLETAA